MHRFDWSRRMRAALVISALAVSLTATAAAQSPVPSGPLPSIPPSPPPSPAATNNPNGWPPVRFVGGSPDVMWVTSDCGIPGVSTFHLTGVGPEVTGWFDVTLTEYDVANMRYTGREIGQVFGANNTVWEVDGDAFMAYDPGSGNWLLKGSWINEAPIENCPLAPSPGI